MTSNVETGRGLFGRFKKDEERTAATSQADGVIRLTESSEIEAVTTSDADQAETTRANAVAKVGVSDLPAPTDLVGVDPYARGLAEFIAGCPTPMTVAIQGGWGSGKTSTMTMVEASLRGMGVACDIVRFNTWQYAHTDLGEGLTFHLVNAILDSSKTPPAEQSKREAILATLRRQAQQLPAVAVRAAVKAADAAAAHAVTVAGGEMGSDAYKAIKKSVADSMASTAEEMDSVRDVVDVRAQFADLIRTRIQSMPGADGRVVVFIDDLDRLQPARAVEVMESLKALLDCAGCVFVLAVDFEVVQQGVSVKYPGMTEEKARAFFDKIIQVPFHMPVSAYDLTRVLDSGLEGIELTDEVRELCRTVGSKAVGNNPRAAKRLINSFVMLRRVRELTVQRDEAEDGNTATMQGDMVRDDGRLFTFLALKAAFPGFAEEAESISSAEAAHFVHSALATAQAAADDEAAGRLELWGVEANEINNFAMLLGQVIDSFDLTDGESAASLGQITHLTGITSVGARTEGGRVERSTVLPLDERAARLRARGVDEARIDVARRIEDSLRAAFVSRGLAIEGAEAKNGAWTLAIAGGGVRRKSRVGQIYFPARKDWVQVTVPWPRGESPAREVFGRTAQELAEARGWVCAPNEGAGYLTLRGIQSGDELQGLTELVLLASEEG